MKVFAFTTGICAFVGSIALVLVVNIQRATEGVVFPKLLATIACIGNILYVSPNIPTWVNVQTSTDWASDLNNAVTGVSLLKGMAAIPAVNISGATAVKVGYAFAITETLINAAWNAPVINNLIQNQALGNTVYKSLVGESVANFAFNIGGMMEFPIVFAVNAGDVEVWMPLALSQGVFMLTYGIGILVAGSMYCFMPNQKH